MSLPNYEIGNIHFAYFALTNKVESLIDIFQNSKIDLYSMESDSPPIAHNFKKVWWSSGIEEGFMQKRRQISLLLFRGHNLFCCAIYFAPEWYEEKDELNQDDMKKGWIHPILKKSPINSVPHASFMSSGKCQCPCL